MTRDNGLCNKCNKKYTHGYDSLVLCDEHNEPMNEIMSGLLNAITAGCKGKVTVIKDLGLN